MLKTGLVSDMSPMKVLKRKKLKRDHFYSKGIVKCFNEMSDLRAVCLKMDIMLELFLREFFT